MEVILSKAAPAPVGPYSQAIRHAGVVYLSGQIPLDPATGKLVGGDIEAQTERVLENLRAVLSEAGSGFGHLLRVSVFLMDMREFPRFNAVYARILGEARPARSTVQVAALPLGASIEIDAIAAVAD